MIRLAKKEEIPQILALTAACAEDMTRRGIDQWNAQYPSKEAFENDFKRHELFILIHGNEIAGTITISTQKDKEYQEVDWLTKDANQYYIHRLAVHPKYQGQGFARSLMDFAEDRARVYNVTAVRLDTFSKNQRNQKFYEARGYQRLGSIYFPKQSEHPFYCYELLLNPKGIG